MKTFPINKITPRYQFIISDIKSFTKHKKETLSVQISINCVKMPNRSDEVIPHLNQFN